MFRSMTSFGRCRKTLNGKDITVEVKSVNNRFLDCSVKLPRQLTSLEDKVRARVKECGVSRGKIDVFVTVDTVCTENPTILLDKGYAAGYLDALRSLRDTFSLPDDISTMRVAQIPGVLIVGKPEEDLEREWEELREVLDGALAVFTAGREREGNNLLRDIREKLTGVRRTVEEIAALSVSDIAGYREKLASRIRDALADNAISADESRLLTECALYADKVAIDEEIVRLGSHFDAFDKAFDAAEPIGRNLDFLMQEMNREINTIGSKCCDADIAHRVVFVKTEFEKIREQIQNIE